MTVTSITRSITHTLDGTTTVFAIPYKWLDNAWISVERNGVVLSNGADYTLSGVGEASGQVTLASPGTAGWDLIITRTVPLTQLTRFRNRGGFLADDIEAMADTLTMIAQQLVGGSLVPSGLDAALYQLPEPDALKLLGWNSTATGLINVSRAQIVTDGGGGGGGGSFDIAALTELAETPANDDFLPLQDTSAGAARKASFANVLGALLGDARYYVTSQSFTAAVEAHVRFATAAHTTLQRTSYSTSTWELTATASTRVFFAAHVALASVSPGGSATLIAQKNGSEVVGFDYDKVEADGTSRTLVVRVFGVVSMEAGDTLRWRLTSSVNASLVTTAGYTALNLLEQG